MTNTQINNLDIHLAKTIHESLLTFKEKLPEGILMYSHIWEEQGRNWETDENVSNDTEWFLNELLWTFNHIQGEEETAESKILFNQISEDLKNNENITTNEAQAFINALPNHPDYPLYKGLQRKEDERVRNGLNLFAKYFRSLWY